MKKLILIGFIALIPRLIWITTVPAGINFDEIDYLLSAKAFYYSGTDITNRWNPLNLTPLPGEDPKGELPTILLAPFVGPFDFSLLTVKLPFIVAGVISVFLLYSIARKLFNAQIALIASLLMAINPLAIFSSRIGFDGPLTSMFVLATIASIGGLKGKRLLLALPLIFIAFYGYVAIKLVLFPLVAVTCFYSWMYLRKKQDTKMYLTISLFSFILLAIFIVRLPHLSSSDRISTILSPNSPEIVEQVDNLRRDSLLVSPKLTAVFINKWSIAGLTLVYRYLEGFSPEVLFFTGDTYHFFFMWHHGIFYLIDILTLPLGIYVLAKRFPKQGMLLLVMILISSLPAVINNLSVSYVYRAYTSYLLLNLIAALGVNLLISRKGASRVLVTSTFVGIYLILFARFTHEYYILNPVYHQDQAQFTHRVLSRFLQETAPTETTVVAADPEALFHQYIIYSGLYNQLGDQTIRTELAQKLQESDYSWNNITFTHRCEQTVLTDTNQLLVKDDIACDEYREVLPKKYLALARISDSGHEFRIYQNQICDRDTSLTYINRLSFSDLQVEALPTETFCTKYFTRNL